MCEDNKQLNHHHDCEHHCDHHDTTLPVDIKLALELRNYIGFGYDIIDKDVKVFRIPSNNLKDVETLVKEYCENMFLEYNGVMLMNPNYSDDTNMKRVTKKINDILKMYKY